MGISYGGLGTVIGGGIGAFTPIGPLGGAAIGGGIGGMVDSYLDDGEADERRDKQLKLAREQQAKWDAMFGPVQENLADYYKTLSPESFAAAGLRSIEADFEAIGISTRQNLAQRGLAGSGLEQDLAAQQEIAKAEAKATVRADAPLKVAKAKQSFLNIGLQQAGADNSEEQRILGAEAARLELDAANTAKASSDLIGIGAEILGKKTNKPDVVEEVQRKTTLQPSNVFGVSGAGGFNLG